MAESAAHYFDIAATLAEEAYGTQGEERRHLLLEALAAAGAGVERLADEIGNV